MLTDFIPLFITMVLALGLALTLLNLGKFLGPKRANRIKTMAYESGMDPVGTARERYSVKFYLVAMIFIVFDVEVVFMYPWAVSFQEFLAVSPGAALGVTVVIVFFVLILAIGLLYDIKKGGLEF